MKTDWITLLFFCVFSYVMGRRAGRRERGDPDFEDPDSEETGSAENNEKK